MGVLGDCALCQAPRQASSIVQVPHHSDASDHSQPAPIKQDTAKEETQALNLLLGTFFS